MKRLQSTLLAAVVVATAVSCGGHKRMATPAAGAIIRLTDSLLEHGGVDTLHFGRLHEGEIAVKHVALQNDSKETTIVVGDEVSCGCVSADYDRRPIAAGGCSDLAVTFDSRGEFGWQMKLLTLRLGRNAVPLRIFVEAEVE